MANFVFIIDPNSERRQRYIKEIKANLSPVNGLAINECSAEDFCAVWAADTRAPISYEVNEKGVTIIWGDAIRRTEPGTINATELAEQWCDPAHRSKAVFDGFYAGVVYRHVSGFLYTIIPPETFY